jgi:hypothetical protein
MEEVIDKKQKLLLEFALADRNVFVQIARILKPSYFDKPLDKSVQFIIDYFNEYHNLPKLSVIDAETGIKLEQQELENGDEEYLLDEIEAHCKEKAMTEAILDSVDLIKDGKTTEVQDLVRNALMVKLDNNVGTDLFEDAFTRITMMDAMVDERRIGIPDFDELVGNVRRGELLMVYAPSSGGKSIFLANIAEKMAKQKTDEDSDKHLDACVISLELNENLYSKRLDTILTATDIKEHHENAKMISDLLNSMKEGNGIGSIITKKMPVGTKVSEIRTYLMEYHLKFGKYPDILIVDYLALLGASSKKAGQGAFEEQGEICVDLRQLGEDIDCFTFSAGQLGREAMNVTDVHPGHVAGGISVINGSDTSIALVANEQDIDNNQMQCVPLKLRNAAKTTKPVILYKCPKTLRISDQPFDGGKINVGDTPIKKNTEKKSETVDKSKGKSKLKRALDIT